MESEVQEEAVRWYVRMQDVAATDEDWMAFIEWQEADPANARACQLLDQTWAAADLVPLLCEPANDRTIPHERDRPKKTAARSTWLLGGLAIAAGFVMTVGLWPELSGAGAIRTFSTTTAPLTVDLDDGSKIYLNRHTVVRVRLARQRRLVTFDQGEASFDVRHDASRPFTVDAGQHSVRVLGTAFNIVRQDSRFRVGVARGVVSVTAPGLRTPARLTVGQQFDQVGTAPAAVSAIAGEQAASWREGILVYRDRPLSEVAADLSRYFGAPVSVDPSAEAIRFTGSLRIADQPTMLDKLDDYLPIAVDQTQRGVRLSARVSG